MNKNNATIANMPTVRISVPGSKGRTYTITVPQSGAPAYCDCASWRFSKLPPQARSCKHLAAFRRRFN